MKLRRAVRIAAFSLVVSFAVLFSGTAAACTTIVAGRDATGTGRVVLGHNEDDKGVFSVLHAVVPPRTFGEGATLPCEPGRAAVPQVRRTCGFYWSEVRADGRSPSFADVFLNDRGVAVVSNNARGEPVNDPSRLVDGGLAWALRLAVAERAQSARHAVDVITNLVSVWGYSAPGRIYTVADRDEAWIVELAYGRRRFIARRVADDEVALIPNAYTIRAKMPGDICSPDVAATGPNFDFAAAFQSGRGWKTPNSQGRWRNMVRMIASVEWPTDDYPFSVKPSGRADVKLFRKVLTSHFEGTPDEVPVNPADGTRHDESVSTPICRRSTVESTVFEFGDTPADTRVWISDGPPCRGGYRSFFPFRAMPRDIDRSADALARLASHPL